MPTSEIGKEVVEDIIEHFGTKGMRWGIRKRDYTDIRTANKQARAKTGAKRFESGLTPSSIRRTRAANKEARNILKEQTEERRAAKKADKDDKKFAKQAISAKGRAELNDKTMTHFYAHVGSINNKPEYQAAAKAGTLLDTNHPTTKKYEKEVSDLYVEGFRQAAQSTISPSGRKRLNIRPTSDPSEFDVILEDIEHSATIKIIFEKDENGLITGVHLDEMAQGELAVGMILEHFGVKGMKWGVRRDRPSGPQPVTVRPSKFPGSKRLVTKGGKGHGTTEEATRSREIGRIGQKSGTKALSNKQLEEYNRRLNLEQNFNRLSYEDKNPGQKFVATVMGHGQRQVSQAGNDVASHQVKKRLAKRGLVAAGKKAAVAAAV